MVYAGIAAEPEVAYVIAENAAELEIDRIGGIQREAGLRRVDRSADVMLIVCKAYADIGPKGKCTHQREVVANLTVKIPEAGPLVVDRGQTFPAAAQKVVERDT